MKLVAETNFPFGRGVGFVFIFLGVAIEAIALYFGVMAFATLGLFRQHQIIRVLTGLRGDMT